MSREIRFFAAVADSPGFDWLSSVKSSNFRPRTPPAALISSIASTIPLCDDWPKAGLLARERGVFADLDRVLGPQRGEREEGERCQGDGG